MLGAVFRCNVVAQRDFSVDIILKVNGACQQCGQLARGDGVVVVQGNIIHRFIALLEYLTVPVWIMIKIRRRGNADSCFNGAVNPLHGLGNFVRLYAVPARILVPGRDLPGTVGFVAEIPDFYAVGILVAVRTAQVGPVSTALVVGVLGNINGVIDIAGAEVDGIHRLESALFRPLQVFIVTDFVGDILEPGKIQMGFALVLRTNGIFPVPAGNEVAARQTYGRDSSGFQRLDPVAAEALLVGCGMLGVEHIAVDHRTDGLKEAAVKTGRGFPDFKRRMYCDFGFFRHTIPPHNICYQYTGNLQGGARFFG